MITWREAVVEALGPSWGGAHELTVRTTRGEELRALAYLEVSGAPRVGQRVLVTTGALAKGLGTGGYAFVVVAPEELPADPPPAPGHLVKDRYSPLQRVVLGVDDEQSEHHGVLRDADDLEAMPVVTADLHSALPAIVAGVRHGALRSGRPLPRVAYVMTDGGAIPAAFSRTVAALREAGWLEATVTVGQAHGGDLEAVTVHTGLLAARHVVGADVTVVVQGPGNLGTGTRWGFSGVAAGEAVNAAGVLGGRPVASLRVSGADPRERHLGVSHHSLTAYGRVALVPADVVVPEFAVGPVLGVPDDDGVPPLEPGSLAWLGARVRQQVAALVEPAGRHRLVEVEAGGELLTALGTSPVRLSTMGRSLDDDPGAFLAAAVAGVHAAELVAGN